jgi:hypothetical protein
VYSALGALSAVLTIVTAVLFYFGWRRSDVQAREMSIDVSLFGFTFQDYVLRSISSLYLPLLVLAAAGLGWLWLHSLIVRLLRSDVLASDARRATAATWTAWVTRVAAAVAVGCLAFTLAAGLPSPPVGVAWLAERLRDRQWLLWLVLVLATLTAAYSRWCSRQLSPSAATEPKASWQVILPGLLIAATVALGGFSMLEQYASAVGRGWARQLAAGVDSLARTVVISPTPLGIQAPGVHEERLGEVGSPEVRYRTTGLRLLARSGGKVLLLHEGWTPETGTVIVLGDSEALSWQFSR